MHCVFAANGTWGDVGPLAELAVRVAACGVRVTFVSTPFFAEGLAARGLEVRSAGPFWDPVAALADPRLRHPVMAPVHIWRLVFQPLLAPMFEAARAALLEEPGPVVLHPWCFGAQLAAESVGAPWAMTALTPVTWFSTADVPVTGPVELPAWLARAQMAGPTHLVLRSVFGKGIASEARRRGLPEKKDRFFAATRDASLNLALWPRAFRGPAVDDPPRVAWCGFPQAAAATALPELLERFLAEGPAPVVVGLGSALPALAQDLYDRAEEACRSLGLRAVLVGAAEREPSPGVLRLPAAPYASLFPRARVVVHHGGIGTTAEALQSGRPQLVIPFGADQHDNAARVVRLGAGRRRLRDRVTAPRLAEDLRALTETPSYLAAAKAAATALAGARPGLDVAAEHVLELVRGAGGPRALAARSPA